MSPRNNAGAISRLDADAQAAGLATAEQTSERVLRRGQAMILAGSIVTVLAVVGYSLACFHAESSASLYDIVFANSVPYARAALVGLGLGTVLWLVGSFVYLHGAIGADAELGEDESHE